MVSRVPISSLLYGIQTFQNTAFVQYFGLSRATVFEVGDIGKIHQSTSSKTRQTGEHISIFLPVLVSNPVVASRSKTVMLFVY